MRLILDVNWPIWQPSKPRRIFRRFTAYQRHNMMPTPWYDSYTVNPDNLNQLTQDVGMVIQQFKQVKWTYMHCRSTVPIFKLSCFNLSGFTVFDTICDVTYNTKQEASLIKQQLKQNKFLVKKNPKFDLRRTVLQQ